MDGVGAEVNGAAGVDEVAEADATLRSEVPDTGVGIGAVVRYVVGRPPEGRVFVIGPEHAAGGLGPGHPPVAMGEVPAEDDRCDGDAGEGSAYGVWGGAGDDEGVGRLRAAYTLELGGVGLPEGEELDGVLEVAVEGAGTDIAGEDLARMDAGHEELEAVPVVGDTLAALEDGSDVPGEAAVGGGEWGGFCGGWSGGLSGQE